MRISSLIAATENFFINTAGPSIAAAGRKATKAVAAAAADAREERNARTMAELLTRDPREIALIEQRALEIAERRAKIDALHAALKAAKRS